MTNDGKIGMRIVLVYEVVPEDVYTFILEVTPEEWAWIKLTDGNYRNIDIGDQAVTEAISKLREYLADKVSRPNGDGPLLLRGENIDYLVVTGEIL